MQGSRPLDRLRAKPVGFHSKRSNLKDGAAPNSRAPNNIVARALVDLHSATDADGVFTALRSILREEMHFSFMVFQLRGLANDRESFIRIAGHPGHSEADLRAILERADEVRRRRKQKLIRLSDANDVLGARQRPNRGRARTVPALLMGFEGCGYARASLLVARARADDEFRSGELEGLERLQPHVVAALRGVRTLQRERVTRLALQKLLSRFPVGIVLLDWEGRALYRNAAATELCALWNHGVEGRSLNASRVFRVPKEVMSACRSLESQLNGHQRAEVSVLSPGEPRVRAVVQSVRFEVQLLGRPRHLVHFEAVGGKRGSYAGPTRMDLLLRLTPRERELAEVVARGVSNADAARRLGKSVHTIKKQLQSVYRKLGVKNRARVVALLAR